MSPAATLLAPLDAARSGLYRGLAPWLAPFYGDRERRVAVFGAASVAVAFAVTATVPLWSLALAPLLLGVPHLLADVRYLVVRPGLHRDVRLVLLVGLPLLGVSLGAGAVSGLLAVLAAVLLAGGPARRTAPLVGAWGGLLGLALAFPIGFQLVFLHLHNAVALLVWWVWRPRGARSLLVPAAALLGAAALLLGAAEPSLSALGTWAAPWTGTSLGTFVETTTPLEDSTLAVRLVLVFCFLQQVHYGAWLRLIPDDDRARPAPRTFRASWAALERDFGRAPLLVAGALTVGFAAWGAVSLPGARLGYLHLAAFHGYLEVAALARLAALGRRA